EDPLADDAVLGRPGGGREVASRIGYVRGTGHGGPSGIVVRGRAHVPFAGDERDRGQCDKGGSMHRSHAASGPQREVVFVSVFALAVVLDEGAVLEAELELDGVEVDGGFT